MTSATRKHQQATTLAPGFRTVVERGRGREAGAMMVLLMAIASGCATSPLPPALPPEIAVIEQTETLLPPVTAPLAVQDALGRARIYSPELRRRRAQVATAESLISVARQWRDPQLRLNYGEGDSESDSRGTSYEAATPPGGWPGVPFEQVPDGFERAGNSFGRGIDESESYRLAVRIFPPNPWTQSAGIAQAKADYYAAIEAVNVEASRLEEEVLSLFTQFTFSQRNLLILEELVKNRKTVRDEMQRRAHAGQLTVTDMANASRRYLEALADRHEAALDLDEARAELAALVGAVPAELEVIPLTPPTVQVESLAARLPELSSRAVEIRPDLRLLGWEAAAARARYRLARSTRIPWFSHIQGSYAVSEETRLSSGAGYQIGTTDTVWDFDHDRSTNEADEWEVSVAVDIPLFSWISSAAKARKVEWQTAEWARQTAEHQARAEIGNALARLAALSRRQRSFQAEIEPLAAEIKSTAAQAEANQALFSPEALGRIREELLMTRLLQLESERDFQEALIALHAALGGLPSPANPAEPPSE